jgi:hypothetical protein
VENLIQPNMFWLYGLDFYGVECVTPIICGVLSSRMHPTELRPVRHFSSCSKLCNRHLFMKRFIIFLTISANKGAINPP